MLKNEQNKISFYSVKIWSTHTWIIYFITYIIGLFMLFLSMYKEWYDRIPELIIVSIIILCTINFIEIKFIVPLRYKNFSYNIYNEYIAIHQGGIFKKKIIIPTNKIYYVNRKSGPLLDKYNLENVVIGTLAGEHVIPCLNEEVARNLQTKIINICEIQEYKEA